MLERESNCLKRNYRRANKENGETNVFFSKKKKENFVIQ